MLTQPTGVNILAFTGTRKGMSPRQVGYCIHKVEELQPTEVHHGGARGADAEFHEICLKMGVRTIHVWPSNLATQQGDLRIVIDSKITVILHPEQPPLDRNRDIVRPASILIACPDSAIETIRSGTWSTVRYASQFEDKQIFVVKPFDDETI